MTALLSGQTERHLCSRREADSLGARVHRDVVEPFRQLRDEAREAGFELRILSGFRSFDDQLSIWNRKVAGERAVLDSDAVPLDIASLDRHELVLAILRWSALPGASRHHWGTDLDVYDAAAKPDDYEIELVPAEVRPGGMFGPLHDWLDSRIETGSSHGFYRPYEEDRGGVAPERWHLSHGPIASAYFRRLTPDALREVIAGAEMGLKDEVLEHLDEIYERFVINVAPTP
ncbi:MAG: M15 family metallopeptidase [Gemmatimonadetes bacterium]|nr:M15 family metallopeptidase [Gemmatimonadota bacterium]